MAPSLEALSEELLVRIVTLTDRPSLHPLALTSRTLNRISTPALYASIDLKGSISRGIKFLIPLTYHLLKNADLAAMVRSLAVPNVYSCEEDNLSPLNDGKDSAHRKGWPDEVVVESLLQSAMEDVEATEEDQRKSLQILRQGSDEGLIIAVLLAKLLNLRKLDIVGSNSLEASSEMCAEKRVFHFMQKVVKREAPFDRRPVLSNLSEVLVSGWDEKYPNSPDMIGAYMELPSIRRVHGYQLGNNGQDAMTESLDTLGRGTSPVEELELRQTQLYAADLDKILKSCRNLKTFIYEVGHAWAWYPLRTSDIMGSMKAVEKSLENLVFDHSEYVGDAPEDDELGAVSLATFERLRYLKISAMLLGGFKQEVKLDLKRTFPAALEELHITYVGDPIYCPPWIPAALQEVMERKEIVFPLLRRLTLQGRFISNVYRLNAIKRLVQTSREKGVEVVVLADDGKDTRSWEEKERRWGFDEDVVWRDCCNDYSTLMTVVHVEGKGW